MCLSGLEAEIQLIIGFQTIKGGHFGFYHWGDVMVSAIFKISILENPNDQFFACSKKCTPKSHICPTIICSLNEIYILGPMFFTLNPMSVN